MISKHLSKLLKALADENRRLILWFLKKRKLCVCELEQLLPVSQSTISIHLRMLSDLNLVDSYKEGRWVIYQWPEQQEQEVDHILNSVFAAMDTAEEYHHQLKLLKTVYKDNLCD